MLSSGPGDQQGQAQVKLHKNDLKQKYSGFRRIRVSHARSLRAQKLAPDAKRLNTAESNARRNIGQLTEYVYFCVLPFLILVHIESRNIFL